MDAQDKQFKKKLHALNNAYKKIEEARLVIETLSKATADMSTVLWRFSKAFKDVNREVLKQLKKENLDDTFRRITKDL